MPSLGRLNRTSKGFKKYNQQLLPALFSIRKRMELTRMENISFPTIQEVGWGLSAVVNAFHSSMTWESRLRITQVLAIMTVPRISECTGHLEIMWKWLQGLPKRSKWTNDSLFNNLISIHQNVNIFKKIQVLKNLVSGLVLMPIYYKSTEGICDCGFHLAYPTSLRLPKFFGLHSNKMQLANVRTEYLRETYINILLNFIFI